MKHIANSLFISAGMLVFTNAPQLSAKNSANSGEKKRPNILFCVADDAGHFSAYGHKWVTTPNFDSVASKGILFPTS